MRFVKYDITFETELVMATFLDFQGFQGKEKQNDCSFKL